MPAVHCGAIWHQLLNKLRSLQQDEGAELGWDELAPSRSETTTRQEHK